jgi:hypothetical protein
MNKGNKSLAWNLAVYQRDVVVECCTPVCVHFPNAFFVVSYVSLAFIFIYESVVSKLMRQHVDCVGV